MVFFNLYSYIVFFILTKHIRSFHRNQNLFFYETKIWFAILSIIFSLLNLKVHATNKQNIHNMINIKYLKKNQANCDDFTKAFNAWNVFFSSDFLNYKVAEFRVKSIFKSYYFTIPINFFTKKKHKFKHNLVFGI